MPPIKRDNKNIFIFEINPSKSILINMKALAILLIFTLLVFNHSKAQSIQAYLQKPHNHNPLQYGFPKQIIETKLFYYKSKTTKHTKVLNYSQNLDTLHGKTYQDSRLTLDWTDIFNQKRELIYSSTKSIHDSFDSSLQSNYFKYDSTGLIEVQYFDNQNNLTHTILLVNDTAQNPISLKVFNTSGKLIQFETADYNYTNNTWISRKIDQAGSVISKEEKLINLPNSSIEKFNPQCDCIIYTIKLPTKDFLYFQVEYTYDQKGNWIEKRIYRTKKVKDKFKGKKLDRKFQREIIYQEGH